MHAVLGPSFEYRSNQFRSKILFTRLRHSAWFWVAFVSRHFVFWEEAELTHHF